MKKIVLVFSLALASLSLSSQENAPKERYKTNGLWANWFASLGGGASFYWGDKQRDQADFLDRQTWGATVSVGKWFTPLVGGRLTFQGGQKHTFSVGEAASNPGHKMATGHYLTVHGDALLNFSNLVAGYKANRVYNLIPYVGVGIGADRTPARFTPGGNKSFVPVVGLLNSFRISESFAIFIDVSGQAVQSKWNDARFDTKNKSYTKSFNRQDWDGVVSANLGVTFGLGGKQTFDKAEDVVVKVENNDDALNELNKQIEKLYKQIDSLFAENQLLKKELENAKSEVIIKDAPYPVLFKINSSTIDPKQEAIIYNVAELLKENSNTVALIVGLADKGTGTPAYNEILSKKRAIALENKLITDYGISKDRIAISWKGDTVQPYPVNEWNRVVIISVVDSK
ncbi:MAG: OmpA family protein [Flavobacteriaceae bacterium]|jgi:outer membrane protein OmpA-like peptidoglycan-associated protein|nr:OmpA family protein [Flavobacteriaceae bacterium]